MGCAMGLLDRIMGKSADDRGRQDNVNAEPAKEPQRIPEAPVSPRDVSAPRPRIPTGNAAPRPPREAAEPAAAKVR
ncbi:MAG: hypothetical protein FWD37_07020, partial [Methanomassiliicoccaceae archaeon]|nr:hypothetical protein [Methanomassiliicoccaceae archaeon]